MPKKPPTPMGPTPRRPSPEEVARKAVERFEPAPGNRVRLALRVTITRAAAEVLSAEAVRREVNMPTVLEELIEAATAKLKKRAG